MDNIDLFGDKYNFIEKSNKTKNTRNTLSKYSYPDELITVSKISQIVIAGRYVEINKKNLFHFLEMVF